VERHTVLGGEPRTHAVADEAVVLLAPGRLGVVVDAVGVRQEAETQYAPRGAVEGAKRLGEPAQRSGGRPAHDHALAPGFTQDLVEFMRAPGAEHTHDVAAADVDQVLGEQVGRQVILDPACALVAPKQRHVAGIAVRGEAPVEANHVVVCIARGGGQEADPGTGRVCERKHVLVEEGPLFLHREAPAT
jgi:hypothetical protein